MPFKKGTCANPSGRPKKDVNAAGTALRETMVDFLSRNFKKVICDFDDLPARERVRVYCELFRHAVPRLKIQENEMNFKDMTEEELDAYITRVFKR